jgi:hypothetical protein
VKTCTYHDWKGWRPETRNRAHGCAFPDHCARLSHCKTFRWQKNENDQDEEFEVCHATENDVRALDEPDPYA